MLESSANAGMRRRRLVGLAVGLTLTACLVAAFVVLSAGNRGADDALPAAASAQPEGGLPSGDSTVRSGPPLLAGIADSEMFAEAVAHAIFDWDTTAPVPRSEHADGLLAVADPTDAESQGLIADLAAYLPTDETWAYLKQYYTRQWIEIEAITVPDLWPRAVEEAGPGGFAPGTTAYTIEGVRHRSGLWEGDDVSSAHDVTFTLFMVCGPTYPSCHLLRLSRLDEPLQ